MEDPPHHAHCVSCVNQRCSARPDPGVCCDLVSCPLACGAVFHGCKASEHRLLCPLERVPCLNSASGCPSTLLRARMSAHLEVCPAGVVCCTMEWNRWPVSCLDYTSYETLSRGVEEVEQLDMALALQDQRTLLESLKVVAMAPTAAERETATALVAVGESGERDDGDGAAALSAPPVAAASSSVAPCAAASESPSLPAQPAPRPLAQPCSSAKEKIANGINGLNEEHYSKLYQATVETARSLAAALDIFSGGAASYSDNNSMSECRNGVTAVQDSRESRNIRKRDLLHNGLEAVAPAAVAPPEGCADEQSVCYGCRSGTGAQNNGPQQVSDAAANGPLVSVGTTRACTVEASSCPVVVEEQEDARRIAVAQEEELSVVQSPAPTPPLSPPPLPVSQGIAHQRAGHVVLEDRGLVLLEDWGLERKLHNNQFITRGSYGQYSQSNGRSRALLPHGGGRSPLCRLCPQTEDKAVDTSDLEQDEDPMGLGEIDLITAALLFCLEESRECRRISDTIYVDGYHVDFGTQTFTFPAAILVTNTRVGDMASASACDHAAPQLSYPSPFRTLRLGLVLEALEVEAVPHNRYLPPNPRYQHMFPFVCGQSFRRDQFSSHFTNVHGDIHAGLNGWMEHRCPLAYYGCTFSQRRFHPSTTKGAKVVHDRQLRSFGVQQCPGPGPGPGANKLQSSSGGASGSCSDQFSGLPIEILWHIAGFLDSFSLCQLAMVSRTMREVCGSLLQARGIVELQWERRHSPNVHGAVSWQVKNRVWRFSTGFSLVSSWGFSDLPSMSDHLRKCRFNTVERRVDPVPLPAMCTARDGQSLRRVLRHINT